MRTIIISLLAVFLLLGCAAGELPEAPEVTGIATAEEAFECTLDTSFSGPDAGTFGKTERLTGSVTCGAGKQFELKVDGETVETQTVEGNETTTVVFDVPGTREGTLEVGISSEGQTLYTTGWEVATLGNSDVSGVDYDAISFKQWRAMAFDIEAPVDVGRIDVYMKLLEGRTEEGTNIILEIREDDGGEPGGLVDSVKIPITDVTLTYNWIHFDFGPKAHLEEGRYWVVTMVEQTENVKLVSDNVMLHYVTIDKYTPGNDYTLQMLLDVDEKTGFASETSWEELSYDREYNIVVKSG